MEKPVYETHVVKPNLSFFQEEREYRFISVTDEINLDDKINELESLMSNKTGKGKTEKEKDDLYGEAKNLWGQYADLLRNVKYTFYLNRKQYQFLTDLLIEKLEYDVNTVFFAIELTDMLGEWKEESNYKNDTSFKDYTSDATEVTYIYHLISKHKVKGLSHSSYRFAEILKKIGEISKVISYYDTHAKNFSKEIQEWVASFEDGVVIEGKPHLTQDVESSIVVPDENIEEKPKKSSKKKVETQS